jgi:TRAP transporter 4TM/12TM fusion protein
VGVLVWCLTVERFSPGLSAFWATVFMMFIAITHRPIQAVFRGRSEIREALHAGFHDLFIGLITGARNMIGIGVATAAAGIVVGTVTLTGIGLVMTEFIDVISGGNLILALFFTAAICLILGMGLPTTANYIVVSALMAPVLVALAEQNGLIVPLIAVHMFVFYFGILADDTPPVGLAAYAAAAISGGDPIRTGIQGFTYDIRTAVLPFMFIFNTQLLMIGIDHWWDLVFTVASAVIAMLIFAAATQGYFLVRSRLWESLVLLLVTFSLFRPGFWMDMMFPPIATIGTHGNRRDRRPRAR